MLQLKYSYELDGPTGFGRLLFVLQVIPYNGFLGAL